MELHKILWIIVLYKSNLEDSVTFNALSENIDTTVDLLVYDNGIKKQFKDSFFQLKQFNIRYIHDPSNSGLSIAYNNGLIYANKNKKKWLLLLDQDTMFTKDYFSEIRALNLSRLPSSVVAVIPQIYTLNERVISPIRMFKGGLTRPLKEKNFPSIKTLISGINSGTLLKVSYIESIKGFNNNFPLDMLDHWYFKQISKDFKGVYVLKSKIYHDLSVFGNFEENVSISRYEGMLNAERLLIQGEGFLGWLIYKLRLFQRIFRQIGFKNKTYLSLTTQEFFGILNKNIRRKV